jgi:ABC-type protease/lipase transport system fused ATPase/permease subunit
MRVAQGGINFSGGQRQRLAIARAVIRRPAIYLFDDAFSALDVHTDARVRAALGEVSADATVIIVAQRISTVAAADQIIVIDDGRVVGAGTHESLLTDCPPTPNSPIRSRSAPGSEADHDPAAGTADPGMVQSPTERSRDFTGSAHRLVKRLTPQRGRRLP